MSVSTYVNLRPKRSVILPGEGVIARIGGSDSLPVCMAWAARQSPPTRATVVGCCQTTHQRPIPSS